MNLFLFTIAALPFSNFLASIVIDKKNLGNFINKISPILFFILLCGVFRKSHHTYNLELFGLTPDISFSININHNTIFILFLLNFLWLILTFYADRFSSFRRNFDRRKFQQFLVIFITFINLIILSSNLITLLFAYVGVSFSYYFLLRDSLFKQETNPTDYFLFLIFGEIIFR